MSNISDLYEKETGEKWNDLMSFRTTCNCSECKQLRWMLNRTFVSVELEEALRGCVNSMEDVAGASWDKSIEKARQTLAKVRQEKE